MAAIHFGNIINYGDYESPCIECDSTLCGLTTEKVCEEYATDDWDMVTCKNCLRSRDKYLQGIKEDEEHIVEDMGNFIEFINSENSKN